MKISTLSKKLIIAENKRSLNKYFVIKTIEVGLVLQGQEVKSLRQRSCSIHGSYAFEKEGEFWLANSDIKIDKTNCFSNYNQKRDRKLLMKKKEIRKFSSFLNEKRLTMIPTVIYFNDRGIAKIELALSRGQSRIDRRHVERERSWRKEKERLFKKTLTL